MKGGQNLHVLQQKKKEQEDADWVKPKPCHACGKVIKGAYGHTTLNCGTIWSCSATCEKVVQSIKQGESRAVS
jgi:hypothetical protein